MGRQRCEGGAGRRGKTVVGMKNDDDDDYNDNDNVCFLMSFIIEEYL